MEYFKGEDIFGLDISMDDWVFMHVRDSCKDLEDDITDSFLWLCTTFCLTFEIASWK